MRILITGENGQLAREFRQNLQENSDLELFFLGRNNVDLRDCKETFNKIKSINPDIVIHTAAHVGGIHFNIANPYEMLSNNLLIDSNVIHSSFNLGISNLIYFGSSCMYSPDSKQPFEVESILSGRLEPTNENYALAKIVGTKLANTIDLNSDYNYKTFVLSNLYGPFDNFQERHSHVLASAILKIIAAKENSLKKITIWGTGKPRREFTLANDVASWVVENLNNLRNFPSTLNLGAGVDHSITTIYEIVAKSLNLDLEFEYDTTMPDGIESKLMNSDVAKDSFSWNPNTNLELGVKSTIQLMKKGGS
jgi:GDP-L-fucose synthase